MADVEYSDEYAVYASRDGIRYLTNKVSIQILDILSHGDRNTSDLADLIGVPASSIQSNVMKLVKGGFIEVHPDDEDKRKVYYSMNSYLLMRSVGIDPKYRSIEKEIMDRTVANGFKMNEDILVFTSLISHMVGVDIDSLIQCTGRVMADHIKTDFAEMSEEDAINAMKELADSVNIVLDDFQIIDDKVIFGVATEKMGTANTISSCHLVVGFIGKLMQIRTGRRYYIESIETNDAVCDVVLGSYRSHSSPIVVNDILRSSDDDWKYDIYCVDGRSILFGNTTQMRILKCLRKKDLSLKQLSDMLEISSVTVHMNIGKLLEIGAVVADNDTKSKYVRYVLVAKPVFLQSDIDFCVKRSDIEEHLDNTVANRSDTNFIPVFKYMGVMLRSLGLDNSGFLYEFGKCIADSIISLDSNIAPQRFIDVVCNVDIGFSVHMRVISYIPLCLGTDNAIVERSKWNVIAVYEGMIVYGLKKLTGESYKVFFVKDDEHILLNNARFAV